MSDSPSTSKETTRRIIFHRRNTPYRRFKHIFTRLLLTLSATYLITSITLDKLYPRTLSAEHISALVSLIQEHNGTLDKELLTEASIPPIHILDQQTETIATNPPVIVKQRLLYWTPVESLTLLTYPSSPPVLHPAVPVGISLYPLSQVSITPLSTHSTTAIPRFTPYIIHPSTAVTILEHADGFLPTRIMQIALYSAVLTMQPGLLYTSFKQCSMLLLSYTYRCLPTVYIPRPLEWARGVSKMARDRRMKRAKAQDP